MSEKRNDGDDGYGNVRIGPRRGPFRRRETRREFAKRLGIAIAAVPLVLSIDAPSVASAASCLGSGAHCNQGSGAPCCSQMCVRGRCV